MKKTILEMLIFSVFDSKTFFQRTTSEIGYIPFDREFDSTHSYVKKSKKNRANGALLWSRNFVDYDVNFTLLFENKNNFITSFCS